MAGSARCWRQVLRQTTIPPKASTPSSSNSRASGWLTGTATGAAATKPSAKVPIAASWLASPEYRASASCWPGLNGPALQVATPLESTGAAAQTTAPSTRKSTVPPGVRLPAPVTVAMSVTVWPGGTVVGDMVRSRLLASTVLVRVNVTSAAAMIPFPSGTTGAGGGVELSTLASTS